MLNRNKDDVDEIRKLDFTLAQVISMGEPPLRIDFLTQVNLVNFNEAWKRKNMLEVKNILLPVVDYDHLILTKINTGRPKDKLDIDELQKINDLKRFISLNPFTLALSLSN